MGEDALNNDAVKRYIARLQRRKKKKSWKKRFIKCLKYYKKSILSSVMCLALITSILYKMQSTSLPPKKPNMSKKLDVHLKPIHYNHAGNNMNKLQRKVLDMREIQRTLEDKIRKVHRMFENVNADIKQDGGYVNTKQANKMINNALQLYDADKMRIADYACLHTGASILETPNTYNVPIGMYAFFGFPIWTIYSQPTELITSDVTPKHCFAFWGNSARVQIALSQKLFITAITMENVPKAIIGDLISLAPRTFIVYGFEDPHDVKLTDIGIYNYNINKGSIQTFAVPKQYQTMAFAFIEIRILDNYGHKDMTCVYRFRVHGNPY